MVPSSKYRNKLLLFSMATSLAVAVTNAPAAASEIDLQYISHPIGSKIAEHLWGGNLAAVSKHGEYDPSVLVARYKSPRGEIKVTILDAMSHCGLNECPVRVFIEDELVVDMNACSNTDFHTLSSSGSLFIACDTITPLPLRKGEN